MEVLYQLSYPGERLPGGRLLRTILEMLRILGQMNFEGWKRQ